ncbi:MAG: bifunctional folylpolyglutamate synthase/dihydrofolate synthase, partial [Bacteroidales bacterium]|nr:bifunctional folylpolyglutamate synthase/dihydrofolate synthase [Bacteroidales bacterium]
MNYEEVIEFMFNSLPMYQRIGQAAYKADLKNTFLLDDYTGNPHKEFKAIHVAGTNGKGSVSHSVASVLQEAGYKTGLYSSPHLIDYRERIRVDGQMIDKEYVCNFINRNKGIIDEIKPSFFEMSVALAFCYFRDCKVDVAVVEVGMGGRLDSTNIILPELSVITNIGLDHTQFLGDSLEKIAAEKAGIIKMGVPVVIGEKHTQTENVFKAFAKENNAEIVFASEQFQTQITNSHEGFSSFLVRDSNNNSFEIEFGLSGKYQEKNLATILETIQQLRAKGFKITDESLCLGLKNLVKNTSLRGRWEILHKNPLVICDTGHNKEGLEYTIDQLSKLMYEKLRIILGFVNDKNVDSVLALFPKDAEYYFTRASIPRALDENILKEKAEKAGLKGDIFPDVPSAYRSALRNSAENDLI